MAQITLENISRHLTNAVIEKAFKLKTDSEDSVQNIELSRAAPDGDGLIGAVYRITVTGREHIDTFIAKGLVADPLIRKSLNCDKYSNREIVFYAKVLPVLVDLQKSFGAKEEIQSSVPVCYSYHCDGLNDYLLLEDMSQRGYTGIQGNPTKFERDSCLKALAHLHAVSLALRINRPDDFAQIEKELAEFYYTTANREWYEGYLRQAMNIALAALAEYEDSENSVYYTKLAALVKNAFGHKMKIATANGKHKVLTHGDAWLPNFLFSEDSAVVIDFQLLRCASIVTDVSYLILMYSNVCPNKNEFMIAAKFYYEALSYYLRDIGLHAEKVYSWEDFNEELLEYGKFGLLTTLTFIPLSCADKGDVVKSYHANYDGHDRIPLECLWPVTYLKRDEDKLRVVHAVRTALDVGLV